MMLAIFLWTFALVAVITWIFHDPPNDFYEGQ